MTAAKSENFKINLISLPSFFVTKQKLELLFQKKISSDQKPDMKSKASRSDLKTLTLTLAMPSDDDDDFQNPSQAIAITQNSILSSIQNLNGASPPRKKQKAFVSNGKDNRRGKHILKSKYSRVSESKLAVDLPKGENLLQNSRVSDLKLVVNLQNAGSLLQNSRVSESNFAVNLQNGENLAQNCWVSESKFEVNLQNGENASQSSKASHVLGSIRNGLAVIQSTYDFDSCVSSICNQINPKTVKIMEEDEEVTNDSMVSEKDLAVNLKEGEHTLQKSGDSDDLGSIGIGSVVIRSTYDFNSHVSASCDQIKTSAIKFMEEDEVVSSSMSIESRLLESKVKLCSSNFSDCFGNIESRTEEKNSKPIENLQRKDRYYAMSIESRLLESKTNLGLSNVGDGCVNIKPILEEKNSELVKALQMQDNNYSMSIESKLLELRAKCDSSDGNSELGTQLNVLMDLCCETDEGVLNDDAGNESLGMERDGMVVCPLCDTDITHLSDEMRQVHTNDCLDKAGAAEVSTPAGQIKSDSPQQVAYVNPVLEWLRALGLSRYEEAFIREEVDWETLQWLTEEDLLNIGVVALGPRKKIVHALNELRQNSKHGHGTEKNNSIITTNENTNILTPGNKLITQYFQGPAIRRSKPCRLSNAQNGIKKTNEDSVRKRVSPRNPVSRGKVRDLPAWCCIPGTPFRVDAFRFLRGDCSHWFLTHFHMDHYQGLTRNFFHGKIYCSSITAHLVNMKIGVPWERLQILPLNHKITVAGVNLTCLDANHCPGSIVILFEPPSGKAVLHTGDFRFSAEMADSSILRSCHVHTLILDTTYCNPQYDFPKQEAVIQFVIEAIQAEAFNPKTLFLIGTYTIGKERLFLEVARLLRKKVYVGAAKLRLLRCLELPVEDMQWFTANEMESNIHVVPMWTVASFKRMKHISNQYSDRFNLIVAFSPTGWTFGKGKKKTPGRRWQQGTIIRYEVPYSEHCSFTELREFVQLVSPEHIIPSVNNNGPESADAMIALLMSDP